MLGHIASSIELVTSQDSGGRPVFAVPLVDVACYFERALLKHEDRNGNVVTTRATFYFNGELDWVTRSRIVFGGVRYEVFIANPVYAPGKADAPHHWELFCK